MDPYKVLGLSRDVSDQKVRKAYRLLALKLHPDRNRTNKEYYQQQFVELQEAYNRILKERERQAKCAGTSSSSTSSEFEESSASSESNFSSSTSDSGHSATSEESSSSYSSSYSSTSSSYCSSTASATSAPPSDAGGNDAKAGSRSSRSPGSGSYESGNSSSRTASHSTSRRKSSSTQSSSSKSHSSRSPSPRREVNKEGAHGHRSGSSNHERGRHGTRDKSRSRTRSRSVIGKPSDEGSHHRHHQRSSRHGDRDHGSDQNHRHTQEKGSRHSRRSKSRSSHSHVRADYKRDKRNGKEKQKNDRNTSKDRDRDGGKGKDRHGYNRKDEEEDRQSTHRRHRHKHHRRRHSRSRSGSWEGARSRSHGNGKRGTSLDKTKKSQSEKQPHSRSREISPHRSRRPRYRDNSALDHHEREGEEKPSRASSTARHSADDSDDEHDYGSINLSRKPTQQRWGRTGKGDQETNGFRTSMSAGTDNHDANSLHSQSRSSSPSRSSSSSAKDSKIAGDADIDEAYEFVDIDPTEAIPAKSQRGKLRKQNKQSPPKLDHDATDATTSSSQKHEALDEEAEEKAKDKSTGHANDDPTPLTDYAYPLPDGVLDAREWTHTLPLSLNELFSGKQISFWFSRYKLSGKKKSVVLDVIVPPGCHHGTKILFRNAGHERSDGTKQDIVFRIEEVEHERFIRTKDDLYLNIKLPWVDSLKEVPGEVYIDGIDGREYMFQINWKRDGGLDGTHTVSRGGMPRKDGKGRGKLIVNWEVGDPTQSAWDAFKEAFGFSSSD